MSRYRMDDGTIVEFAENSYHGTRTADTCP